MGVSLGDRTRWLALAALACVPCVAAALPEVASHARPSFIQRTTTVEAGTTALLGIDFRIDPEWHLYWNGTNDSGMAPVVELDLPPGYVAQPTRWPAPRRAVAPGGLLDHIYDVRVTLLVPIQIPADASGEVPVRARLRWLECKDICLMGSATIETTLTVGPDPKPTTEAAQFEKTLKRLPRPFPPSYDARVESGILHLRAPGAARVAFFAGPDCEFLTSLLEDGEASGEALAIRIDSTEATPRIEGVLETTAADGQKAWYQVDLHPPQASGTESPSNP
ncbi:MAG: hypothetical protein KDA28_03535 [Phycisphaerales bacterium]|nr:hypothetical protein [Phycisphaerales bacterium]